MSMPVLPPAGSLDEPMVGVEESSNSDSIATTVTSQPGTPRPADSENTRSAAATPVPSNPGTPRPADHNTAAMSRSVVDTPPVDDTKMAATSAKTVSGVMAAAASTQPRPAKVAPSKYAQLLNVIEDLGKDIRPTYASSKSSAERLKRGIVHARILVRECLLECERAARS